MPGERPAAILHALNHAIRALEMLPNESSDAGVVGVRFVASVGRFVTSCRSANWNVVDERNRGVGDFGLQDVGDVVVENRY